jgi:hypothetical protein
MASVNAEVRYTRLYLTSRSRLATEYVQTPVATVSF